jgi:uncharacterized protein
MTDTLVIDADSHVTEAADIWTARMSKKWGEYIPHVREVDNKEYWFVGDSQIALVASSSFQRIDPATGERYRQAPGADYFSGAGYRELHPSSYDARARLEQLDELGVYAAVLYPNLNLVVADLHEILDDPQYKIEIIRAYNDWVVEWASADPNRLIPLALVPYFDPVVAAEEAYRCAELGHRGLVTTGMPQIHGQPPLASRTWDPLWSAAQDAGLSINFHVGSNMASVSKYMSPERIEAEGAVAAGARTVSEVLLDNTSTLNDLLLSGVLPRYPDLKFVLVESGMGWIDFCLQAADYHFGRFQVGDARPEFDELPSFYFHRQVYTTYWFEQIDKFHIERLGEDKIMFETDYPHSTSLEAADVQWARQVGLAALPQDVQEKIMWRNAAALYRISVPEHAA